MRLDFVSESLEIFCDLTYLLSAAYTQPERIFESSRVLKRKFLDQYELKCRLSTKGSCTVPIVILTKQALGSSSDEERNEAIDNLEEFKSYFDKTIATVAHADLKELQEQFPIEQNCTRILRAVSTLVHKDEIRLELVRISSDCSITFNSDRDKNNITRLWKQFNMERHKPVNTTQELSLLQMSIQ